MMIDRDNELTIIYASIIIHKPSADTNKLKKEKDKWNKETANKREKKER